MKTKKLTLFILFLLTGFTSLQAQETVPAGGGEAGGSGGSASYTAGQVVYATNVGINGNSAAQGVQQSFEILVLAGIPEAEGIVLKVQVYPNPATDRLTLKVENYQSNNLHYRFFNSAGKLIKTENITATETRIPLQGLGSAIYFLKVTDNNKEIKTFKIIKK
jgi:hypothetical protein